MKLKSMRMSESEAKEQTEPVKADRPRYHYGLGLHFDDQVLDALGTGMPEQGKTVMVMARAKVVGTMEQEFDGRKSRSAQLQITDMAIAPDEGEGGDAADKLYGSK